MTPSESPDAREQLLSLVRMGLGTSSPEKEAPLFRSGLAPSVFTLSVLHGVQALTWDGMQRYAGIMETGMDGILPLTLKLNWALSAESVAKRAADQFHTAAELAGLYAAEGIRTVILKGAAVGQCYPEPLHRPCTDMDCFLMGAYKRGNEIAEKNGAAVDTSYYKHSVFRYKRLIVENHRFCTSVRGSRKAKRFEMYLQDLLRTGPLTKIGDTSLLNPPALFNALFLNAHSMEHFFSKEIVLRHICDWAMFLKREGASFDWNEFIRVLKENDLDRFASAYTLLARDVLGVALPPASAALIRDASNADFLLDEILSVRNDRAGNSGGIWRHRMDIISRAHSNMRRRRRFSKTGYAAHILRLVYGFIFDHRTEL